MPKEATTPLLLLLDSVICQDQDQAENAMRQVRKLGVPSSIPISNLSEVVRLLLEVKPELASLPSEHDTSLPLHFAASLGHVDVAEALIAKNPRAMSTANEKGKIPLHYAAREGRTEMVHFLLTADPKTASIRSKKDKLALHFACGEGHFEVVQALLSFNPEGASIPSAKGKLPLHFASRWGHIPVAQHLLYLYPEGVRARDWDGSLPLHDAAREGQAVMSQFLIDKWPQGLQATNLRGEIPLFAAVRSSNLPLVICLLKAWHKGGKHILQHLTENDSVEDWDWSILDLCLRGAEGNFNGCSMLITRSKCACDHSVISCEAKKSPEKYASTKKSTCRTEKCDKKQKSKKTASWCGEKKESSEPESCYKPKSCHIKKINVDRLSLSKKRLRKSDVDLEACECRFYPIHAALRADIDHRALRVVLRKSGQIVDDADCVGALPIHVAVSYVKNNESIQVCLREILKPHPEAAQVRDNNNRLPLHRALESAADFAFVKALVDVFPKSVLEPYKTNDPNSRSMPPLYLAVEGKCDLSTIFLLVRSDPCFLKPSLGEE